MTDLSADCDKLLNNPIVQYGSDLFSSVVAPAPVPTRPLPPHVQEFIVRVFGETLVNLFFDAGYDLEGQIKEFLEEDNNSETQIGTKKKCQFDNINSKAGCGAKTVAESKRRFSNFEVLFNEFPPAELFINTYPFPTQQQIAAGRIYNQTLSRYHRCLKELMRSAVYCPVNPLPRYRVPAIVSKCILKEKIDEPDGNTDDEFTSYRPDWWNDPNLQGCRYLTKGIYKKLIGGSYALNAILSSLEIMFPRADESMPMQPGGKSLSYRRCEYIRYINNTLTWTDKCPPKCLQSIKVPGYKFKQIRPTN